MNLTINDTRKIKAFLEENLNQPIKAELIFSMNMTKALSNFFFDNLTPYISPETEEVVKAWILSLKKE